MPVSQYSKRCTAPTHDVGLSLMSAGPAHPCVATSCDPPDNLTLDASYPAVVTYGFCNVRVRTR